MALTKEIDDTALRIGELYSALKGTESQSRIVKTINDIMIHGDKIPIPTLLSAWDYFAYKRGATNSF